MRKTLTLAAGIAVWIAGVVSMSTLTPAASSPLQAAAQDVPTFSKDVAPILYKNCTSCHRPGEIAPMSLLTYDKARPYAKAIRDEVQDGNMPPWHAEAAHGTFLNERRLSDEDKIARLASADVFCAPSLRGESFGVALVEAMAAGTPIVARPG